MLRLMNNRSKEERAMAAMTKRMVVNCVRNTALENFHAGQAPVTKTKDGSDIKIIDAEGNEYKWNEVSRITDPEILERRYPVRVREFSIRKDSGGKGQFNGGDGLIREIEFLAPLQVTILSERRVFAPYGLNGGGDGFPGVNVLIKVDGRQLNLGGKNSVVVEAGDKLRVETPGGGAFTSR